MKHICKICGNEYEYDRAKGHSRNICNTCRQNYRKKLLKQRAVKYKGGKCQVCGYDKCENALVFHHLDPKQKDFAIGQKYNLGWPQLKKELDKCILLCANCHAEEHAKGQHKLDDYGVSSKAIEKWIKSYEKYGA